MTTEKEAFEILDNLRIEKEAEAKLKAKRRMLLWDYDVKTITGRK